MSTDRDIDLQDCSPLPAWLMPTDEEIEAVKREESRATVERALGGEG